MKKKMVIGWILLLCLSGIAGVLTMRLILNDRISNEYIRLTGYRHLSVHLEKQKEITESELETAVEEELISEEIYQKDVSSEVQSGDLVNLSFEGYLGESPENAVLEQDDYDLEIGSHTFFDEFEKALIGKQPGTEERLDLKFPESYDNQALAGKNVTFQVKINYIKKNYTKDTLTDQIMQKNTSYDSVDSLYRSIRMELEDVAAKEYEEDRIDKIWEELLSKTKVKKYKEEYLEQEYQKFDKVYEEHAKELNVAFLDFLSDYCGYSLKEYTDQKQKKCRSIVKKKMVVEAIAEKEGIEADSYEELLKEVEKMLIEETTYIQEQE